MSHFSTVYSLEATLHGKNNTINIQIYSQQQMRLISYAWIQISENWNDLNIFQEILVKSSKYSDFFLIIW